tara:strand:+ start:97 stop:1674 length:1578 start_codon:yes stop_codon:yes gene_type:complete
MDKELQNLLNEYFEPSAQKMNINDMFRLVEEIMESTSDVLLEQNESPVETETEQKKLSVTMPVIRISEKMWGKEGSQDREIIQNLLGRLVKHGTTLTEKIKLINNFLENPPQTEDISEILTNIVLLDTLTNIMVHFNASAAGFTFEGFLSALLSGEQVPAGTAGIQDLIDKDDNPISLKLLTEKPGDVHGSYKDLVDHFIDPGGLKQQRGSGQYVAQAGAEGKMTYVVALKSFREKEAGQKLEGKEHIRFFQFDFSAQTFFESLMSHKHNIPIVLLPADLENPPAQTGEMENEQNVAFLEDEVVARLMADQKKLYAYMIKTFDATYIKELIAQFELVDREGRGSKLDLIWKETGERVNKPSVVLPPGDPRNKSAGSVGHEGYRTYAESVELLQAALQESPEKFWQLIALTSGYTGAAGETQFVISANYYKEKGYDKDGFGYVGIIYVGKQAVVELAQNYADVLNQKIFDMFAQVQTLSQQINAYFVAGDKPQALAAAETAGVLKAGAEEYAAKDLEQQQAITAKE